MPPSATAADPTLARAAGAALGGRLAAVTHDLLAAADADRRLVWTNPAWQSALGWSAAELAAGPYHALIHPADRERVTTAERDVLSDRAGTRPEIELRLRAREGDHRWFLFSADLAREDGLVLLVGKDITARRRAEDRARELERSNAELEQFAYVASHDLSEPLRMVSGCLQLLRRRCHGRLDADADELIDYAVAGAGRMRDLIDDLLTVSRAGRGHQPPRPVDTAGVVATALESLRGRADGRAARVVVGALPWVQGDANQLGQLFQNLLGNAVKFVPADRVPEVEIAAAPDGGAWRFTVADNGIGLDPGHADRVFGMFQRLHTRDEYPGTGIGLAIAKQVVERHGGRIWVESGGAAPGCRFHFTLPAARGER